ncbi:Uncharacterised protein [Escherichia coli]|uniref:Uncharacterized protein n=1 Tax=Escherichia coli TaxID=562 RepID=A0A2X3K3X5_ECOLX|nr:Uncharacterised protein [Escherichia coli]
MSQKSLTAITFCVTAIPHHLDAAWFAVRNTDELLGSGVCGVLTV